MKKRILIPAILLMIALQLHAQTVEEAWYEIPRADLSVFTHQDTLRGSITPERAWWDLVHYHLDVDVNIDAKAIMGTNQVTYRVLEPASVMQIDLQEPMEITAVYQDGNELSFQRDGNAYFINLKSEQPVGKVKTLKISYKGNPREAVRAPWDGGFSWKKDKNGNPFVATSCQGLGASVWWPCKDHMYDEPDSMNISITVPKGLTAVSNGRLAGSSKIGKDKRKFNWTVKNPISNYAVNLNIADYVHFSEVFEGEKGKLDCDYYVLSYNLEKAKEQFRQVPMMLEAFEYWFGPYPFYEDGYKLVEVPYLGMEHQSSVTYGNRFANGYLGRDLSGTGWGLKFDFIIIHESGHEWFANSITYRDVADMWIHESFINYSECLYVEYHYGKEAGYEYERGVRRNVQNDVPVTGIYDVNHSGSGDMYPKGSNMLHTIRQLVNDDEKWRSILRGLNETFYHQTVTTKQIEDYMIEQTGLDLQPVFNQYLRTVNIPMLEYYIENGQLVYRWVNTLPDFDMPVKVTLGGEDRWLNPVYTWKHENIPAGIKSLDVNPDFYVGVMNMMGE